MQTQAFQKIYSNLTKITKATCSLKAEGVGYQELAYVDGRPAQVVKLIGEEVTLQIFKGTEGIGTDSEVVFTGHAPTLKVGDRLSGRFLNAYGEPIDGGPEIEGREVEIGGPSVNPVRRKKPSQFLGTGIAGIWTRKSTGRIGIVRSSCQRSVADKVIVATGSISPDMP